MGLKRKSGCDQYICNQRQSWVHSLMNTEAVLAQASGDGQAGADRLNDHF